MTRPRHDPVRHFVGGALVGVGFMMMALCGGCGAYFFGDLAHSVFWGPQPQNAGLLLMPVIFGGGPALVGAGLFMIGKRLRRTSKSGQGLP